ncbi:hypothetical protein WMW72_26730 [Paenibacillus filicis]|uniref:Uncharacterized protein n=1 Tax=Paenibacillus filicis TaxID=669464 RepID=A0ABU9DRL7_9BACL
MLAVPANRLIARDIMLTDPANRLIARDIIRIDLANRLIAQVIMHIGPVNMATTLAFQGNGRCRFRAYRKAGPIRTPKLLIRAVPQRKLDSGAVITGASIGPPPVSGYAGA